VLVRGTVHALYTPGAESVVVSARSDRDSADELGNCGQGAPPRQQNAMKERIRMGHRDHLDNPGKSRYAPW
jgi:hypothetical protein